MKLLCLLLLVGLVSACKGVGSSSKVASSTSLLGTWEVCEDDATIPATSYLSRVHFSGGDDMTFTYYAFNDLGCDMTKLELTEVTEYTYQLSGNTFNTVVQATNLTLHQTTGAISYDVNGANSISLCGFTDWALNTMKNIINLNCDGVTTSLGDVESAAYALSGNQLTLGTLVYTKQ